MDELLTDQQQATRVKVWLRAYVPAAVVALIVGAGGYFGYAQWQARSERQAAEASELFEELRDLLGAGNRDSAEELHQRLVSDFAGSGYADHARLAMAREYVDSTRPSEAAEELRELVASAADRDLRQLARLRLARVYLYMDQPEEGVAVLKAEAPPAAWEQLTDDTLGDLYRALGRLEEARSAYRAALEGKGQVDVAWIRMKLDDLASKTDTPADDGKDMGLEDVDGEAREMSSSASGESDAVAAEGALEQQ